MRGHFFVPFPPDGAPEQEVQERLENNSYAVIPTISVHEAYPGHHWHLVTAKGHPSPIRRTFDTPYFSEGWGLYAEHLMREQGFFAVDFMHTRANLPEPTARAEVARYCAWPTQASAYLTGCLEILRIRERYMRERGGSLRQFHDRLASSGALPIALAEEVALSRLENAA